MDDLIQKAKRVRDQYKELHTLNGENQWINKDYAEGLMGDLWEP